VRRELEDIIKVFLDKMEQKNWKASDLHKAMGGSTDKGMGVSSVYRHLRGGYKYPNARLIGNIGSALGIEPEIVEKAELLAAKMSEKGYRRKALIKKPKIDEINSLDARLRKARNYFQLGRKELKDIDGDISKIIGHLVERMRSLSGLSESMKIFEKN